MDKTSTGKGELGPGWAVSHHVGRADHGGTAEAGAGDAADGLTEDEAGTAGAA